jgi:GT2 family glycosyltransferase
MSDGNAARTTDHSRKVTVVIAAFSMGRWDATSEAVASISAQTAPPAETVLVIDHNPDLLTRAAAAFPKVTVMPNAGPQGASGARNTGVAASGGELVAFLDDDAVADADWLKHMVPHFARPEVVGVGGYCDPLWFTSRPQWFPREFDWVVGASYRGMPEVAGPIRNVWSGNMILRRSIFEQIGGFREDFGKVGKVARPEDTDLCLRAAAAEDGGKWMYEPAAIAGHRVPADRERVSFFLRRCLNEGRGKAELAQLNGAGAATATERRYTTRVLPRGIARGLREAAGGDLSGAGRSLAVAAGLSLAAGGFISTRIARRLTAPSLLQSGRRRPATGSAGSHGR